MATQKTKTKESESDNCEKCGSPMVIHRGVEFISIPSGGGAGGTTTKNYKGIEFIKILQCKVCRFWKEVIN